MVVEQGGVDRGGGCERADVLEVGWPVPGVMVVGAGCWIAPALQLGCITAPSGQLVALLASLAPAGLARSEKCSHADQPDGVRVEPKRFDWGGEAAGLRAEPRVAFVKDFPTTDLAEGRSGASAATPAC